MTSGAAGDHCTQSGSAKQVAELGAPQDTLGAGRRRSGGDEVHADAPARRTTPFGAEANLLGRVEEGQVVRAEPVVSQDDVDVAVHVEDREPSLLLEVPQLQQRTHRAERRASRPVGLTDGSRPPAKSWNPC